MTNIKLTDILLAIVLSLLIWLIVFSDKVNNNYINTDTDTTYNYDTTIYHNSYVNVKPQNVTYVDTVVVDEEQIKKFLNDYFSVYFYKDTLKNDSSATIILEESISKNTILKRDLFFTNNKPIVTINNTIEKKYSFYTGGLLNIGKDNINFGLGGGLKYKKHSLGIYLNTDKNITLNYNYYLK